jgi:hypothetical protein
MGYLTLRYENLFTILLAVIAFVVVTASQVYIKKTYSKMKRKKLKSAKSGMEVAREILDANNLSDVYVVETKGELSDHYDPSRKVIRLSKHIFHGVTVAAASIAAHEVGHAIQDKEKYTFMRIRSMLAPVVSLISYIGYFVIIISIFASLLDFLLIGILILVSTLIFQLVTLPVEFDASRRAKAELVRLNLIDSSEEQGVSEMLLSAALTYVAGLVSTLLNILRLVIMFTGRD